MKVIFLTSLLLACSQLATCQICNIYCDDRDPSLAVNTRIPVQTELFGRKIELFISDEDNMGFGEISNANPADQVWLDRSMDGGFNWEGRVGLSSIPGGGSSVQTKMFNIDNPSARGIGALRVCGKAWDRDDIACSDWARSTVNAVSQVDAAATAMMQMFDGKLWPTTGWWNGANCLTAMVDYMKVTGNRNYFYVIDEVFENNLEEQFGNFTNDYIDDVLWWGLVWVGAYDLTGDSKYLEVAKIDAEYCYDGFRDDVCGGGLWWSTDKDYKNAIPNELFIKLAAALHNRIAGDTKYLAQAIEVWNWFKASGMINSDNLINDGLDDDCKNNGGQTWTYNQGVILGAAVELQKATGDNSYIEDARKLADIVVNTPDFCPGGILLEFPCEDCGGDIPSFKGVFVRNLAELDRFLPNRPYQQWLQFQAKANWDNNRNSLNQFGARWAGPFNRPMAAYQHSSFEAFIAAI